MHDILIGAEGEYDRILTQEELAIESEHLTKSTENLADITEANPSDAFL